MKYNKDEKKLTYEMKMPGDAWMDHVNEHHNAEAVNPLTVEGISKNKWPQQVQQQINDATKEQQFPKDNQPSTKNILQSVSKQNVIDNEHSKDI